MATNDVLRATPLTRPVVPPRGLLGQALNYTLTIWNALTVYAHTGFLPTDNNLAERFIRPVAIGRKKYLFLGSGENSGGDWAATAYSLIGSCQLNGLDPYRYLIDTPRTSPTGGSLTTPASPRGNGPSEHALRSPGRHRKVVRVGENNAWLVGYFGRIPYVSALR